MIRPLDKIIDDHPMPSWRPVALAIIGLLIIAIIWAFFARLDVVAKALGNVVPQGQIKTIQHLEGGIVREFFVREGDKVKKGQILVQLDLGAAGMNADELQVRIDGLYLKRARLHAHVNRIPLSFPEAPAERQLGLVSAERQAYDSRQRQVSSRLEVVDRQIKQKEAELKEFLAQKVATKQALAIAYERSALSQGLVKDKLVSKLELLEIRRDIGELKGKLAEIEAAIPRAKASIAETIARRAEDTVRFRSESVELLRETEVDLARHRELLSKASDQVRRTEVLSPIRGVVKNLANNTVGGVVRAGDPIMEIVPVNEKLVIEAKLSPVDVGFVKEQMKADVKISTYEFIRYGGLEGTVTQVAADANQDQQSGDHYFRVIVETDKSYLLSEGKKLPISSGMQAEVDIHIGTKSVFQYLIQPVLKLKHEAFRER
ncbi:HlyD family type I secretion periplasmic adaptor subunit [Alphaproteobacteria bacterium]|nr:HlyD family type I secretion periplasmic adaptor subunit [Alphaproteobacteria bacterium]